MDTDYAIDPEAVFAAIDAAEVVVFRFVTIPQRLLFDPRHSETEGPLLRMVPPAGSLEERFRALKQLRPRFALPDKITAIWWPKYVGSLEVSGVWQRVHHRLAREGYAGLADSVDQVLRDLCRREQAEMRNAVTGVGYQTLWERQA